jgi:hypothetical protein
VPPADDVLTTDVPPMPCPACGARLEVATGTDRPRPGDVTLCAYCWVYLSFTATLGVRPLADGEWLALPEPRRQLLTRVRDHLRQRPALPPPLTPGENPEP